MLNRKVWLFLFMGLLYWCGVLIMGLSVLVIFDIVDRKIILFMLV